MRKNVVVLIAALVLALVGAVYWPVVHADFIWDDWPSFHDTPWLTQGDQWKHYLFRDFNSWVFYFRPLVLAVLTMEVRLFHSTSGPMHAVSLGLHLLDTALVGLLARQFAKRTHNDSHAPSLLPALAMLLYGLHPALTEPVAWIGCQFDLIETLLTLLGLLAVAAIQQPGKRAMVLALLFFLAACAKESAIAFPLIMIVFDWTLQKRNSHEPTRSFMRQFLRPLWPSYLGMFTAGIAYLAFRHWALRDNASAELPRAFSPFAQFQEACAVYLHYWRIIFWPMPGIGPIHPVDTTIFHSLTSISLLSDITAVGVVVGALIAAWRRSSPTACIVLGVTASLLPVLHIIPVEFERSLYHERYVMTAVAVMCAAVPLIRLPLKLQPVRQRMTVFAMGVVVLFWLVFAVVDIRFMLPNWANDVNLWQWALATNPYASQAKDNLLHSYIKNQDYAHARSFGDQLLTDPLPCANCMLNIAKLAVEQHDTGRAAKALERVRRSPLLTRDADMLHRYYLLTGKMLVQEHQLDDAEQVLRASANLAPQDAEPLLALGHAFALQGKRDQAQTTAAAAIALLPAERRDAAKRDLDTILEGTPAASSSAF